MSKENLENIIAKSLSNQLTNSEIDRLLEWLKNEENLTSFNEYVAVNHILNTKFKKFNSICAYQKDAATYSKKKTRTSFLKYAVAASVALLISVTFYFNNDKSVPVIVPIIVNNTIEVGTDKAVLTLEDGSTVALEKGADYNNDNVKSNGEELVYKTTNKKSIAYNYLTIPRGGQFSIHLADGTQVWLNSESKFKYPVNFIEGENREVELVYGEAYFDVSPSTNHNGATFKLVTQEQTIEVLGTEFNIKAYKDEDVITTTLIEGKVIVMGATNREILNPSQQSIYNSQNETFKVNTVDTNFDTAWRRGFFNFEEKPFEDVAKVLSRWYDVEFYFDNDVIKKLKINGVLRKDQNIEHVLIALKNIKNISYEINENRIYIK